MKDSRITYIPVYAFTRYNRIKYSSTIIMYDNNTHKL